MKEKESRSQKDFITVIVSLITAIVAVASLSLNIYFGFLDRKQTRENEILQQRKSALFNALRVIDHVYANENLDGKPPAHPHHWELQEARDAMNQMIVYCADPKKTVGLFHDAVGLYNPSVEKPKGISPRYLDEFRKQVAIELNLPAVTYSDPNKVWIQNLAGGK